MGDQQPVWNQGDLPPQMTTVEDLWNATNRELKMIIL